MSQIQLYSYYRSSASYRVRIALLLKNLEYEYIPVHLVKDGGEQNADDFHKKNPMGEVPVLVHNNQSLSQSMAIIQYLDAIAPQPLLFPKDDFKRAKVVELCEVVNAGIHPIQNLKVLQKLEREFNLSQEDRTKWSAYWIVRGFQGLEKLLVQTAGMYAFGDEITAADLFICPQVYNARRFNVDMSMFPIIESVEKNCLKLEAFRESYPGVQPDAPND